METLAATNNYGGSCAQYTVRVNQRPNPRQGRAHKLISFLVFLHVLKASASNGSKNKKWYFFGRSCGWASTIPLFICCCCCFSFLVAAVLVVAGYLCYLLFLLFLSCCCYFSFLVIAVRIVVRYRCYLLFHFVVFLSCCYCFLFLAFLLFLLLFFVVVVTATVFLL